MQGNPLGTMRDPKMSFCECASQVTMDGYGRSEGLLFVVFSDLLL